ncbi:MAG TPA: HAD-IA family hydrolase [Kofleriaceae bacterium]|nr:HAD-IA family hydrolase [Kofleriaceae bacterium]
MTVAVTFDAGQTLLRLDPRLLSTRLAERDVEVSPPALEMAEAAAWRAYEQAVARPDDVPGGAWQTFMRALLRGAAPMMGEPRAAELAAWLFAEQPRRNLWRRLTPGILDVVDELRAARVPVAVVSNSEGRLAELLDEISIGDRFAAVADSGRLDVEKPDPRIFDWVAAELHVPPTAIVHVGDSWGADVVGARNAGARAIWFGPAAHEGAAAGDPAVACAADAAALRDALVRWAVLPAR